MRLLVTMNMRPTWNWRLSRAAAPWHEQRNSPAIDSESTTPKQADLAATNGMKTWKRINIRGDERRERIPGHYLSTRQLPCRARCTGLIARFYSRFVYRANLRRCYSGYVRMVM